MILNSQLIEAFRHSPAFVEALSIFDNEKPFYEWAHGIYSFAAEKHPEYMNPHEMAKNAAYFDSWMDRNRDFTFGLFNSSDINHWHWFERFFDALQESLQEPFRDLKSEMDGISLALYRRCPFFKPVIYPYRYDVFSNACEALGISLPEPPITKEYRNYFYFYYDICEAVQSFQNERGLTAPEVCALIYYAMDSKTVYPSEIPEPTNVWFIGGGDGDLERLENTTDQTPAIWQGNEMTRKGDIVVMYVLSPVSAIHSVWRTVTESIFNPFDRYQHRIAISRGIKVPAISLAELKADTYFKELPIVRKNMQGINGVSLSSRDYNELLTRWGRKGFNTASLPPLMIPEELDVIIENERDVEDKILVPALRKLGYFDTDWKRQLKLKKGRKESEIPDFVFFPMGEHLHETAPMVIEAKENFKNGGQFRKDFSQGYSYAQSLHSKYLGLCDKERLVLYLGKDGVFDVDSPVFEARWTNIFSDDDVFTRLKRLIGREVIKDL